MHNLTKIKIFRLLLLLSYPLAFVLIYPFALMKSKNKSGLFFFFDRYAIGGAQKIHIDLLNSIPDIYKQVYFTRYSKNKQLKQNFYSIPNTISKDIHIVCDNLLFRLFSVHYYTFYINRHKGALIFGANSTFFYDLLFFCSKHITKTELLHNFTHGKNGMEFFGLANHKYLDYRIVYDSYTLSNIKKQYTEYNIAEDYLNKLLFIEPGVQIPTPEPHKEFTLPIKVLYAGRGGAQKRIPLLNKIATLALKEGLPIEFNFAGTMMDELSDYVKEHTILHGEISTQQEMYALYSQCHVLLMTSAYEGFPMMIKEGMANGCIPVVTALEGNKMHLKNNENSLLIEQPEDEEHVVASGLANLKTLVNDLEYSKALSHRCYDYAKTKFDLSVFTDRYRSFLSGYAKGSH